MPRVCLRMDDVGASSKRYEVYSKRLRGAGNWLWLKYVPPFRAWGPYREMRPEEWREVFRMLERRQARMTVAITACWVEGDGRLTPFPEKFPGEAEALKEGLARGLLEIANHGLTHCQLAGLAFRPRLFSSNRTSHREFLPGLPEAEHLRHLERSQEVLQQWFGVPVTTLVPPGNAFTPATVAAARRLGFKVINCNAAPSDEGGLRIVGNREVIAFHDRELVLEGLGWLERTLAAVPAGTAFCFAGEL